MEKRYSILILPWRGTGVRRWVLSRRSIRYILCVAVVGLGFFAWLVGDYLWMKLQREEIKRVKREAKAQKKDLSLLQGQTKTIQALLADWKGVQERIEASLPSQRKASTNNHPIAELEKSLSSLQLELERMISSVPSDWPAKGRVTSGVGKRLSPWTGKVEFHSGIDIPNPIGTPVYAPGDGTVELAGQSDGNGRTIVLNHGQGVTTQYAHLSKTHVNRGDQVRKGQQIGEVGNTGKSTSPHLHYEVRVNGVPIDPRRSLIK
jgi:murein DD-endopeptidase MepM/ murein hydrolase activator NlpD